MNLWWLQPGWRETRCACCGAKIWPEGDPDMGICFACYSQQQADNAAEEEYYRQMAAAGQQDTGGADV